jgi:hypothetical protein
LNPAEHGDHPQIDTSPKCNDKDCVMYQSMIGMLQWVISLGRFDIYPIVAKLTRFRAAPHQGHIERIKKVFGY